jgi:hypothetical protein
VRLVEKTGNVESVFLLSVDTTHEFFANDLLVSNCDGALYAWRKVYAYLADKLETKPTRGTKAWFDAKAVEMEEADERLALQEKREQEEEEYAWD